MRRFLLLFVVAVLNFFAAIAGAAPPETCRFISQPMEPGDHVMHSVNYKMSVSGTLTEGKKVKSTSYEATHRQRRYLEVLPNTERSSARTLVAFEQADRIFSEALGTKREQREVVEGKIYVVERQGEKLIVTSEDGQEPPQVERDFVATVMDGIGRVNPLCEFLDGKQFAVGDQIRLPNKVTSSLFAAWRQAIPFADVDLTLESIDHDHGPARAVFRAAVKGHPKTTDKASARLDGQLTVEIDTCRVMAIELTGPVHLGETQTTPTGNAELDCHGTIEIALRTEPAIKRE